jgi:GABA(A) receptor-associated protein
MNFFNTKEINSKEEFKKLNTLEERQREAKKILEKYPDKIPMYISKQPSSKIQEIDKHKFLMPIDLTVGQLLFVIRKRIKIPPECALFVFINGNLINQSMIMSEVYKQEKDIDNFLYIDYSGEATFG